MKKSILLVAVAVIGLASCKKERDCKCTTTTTFGGGSSSSTQTTVLKDVTKSQAKTICYSSTTTDASGAVTTRDCKLE